MKYILSNIFCICVIGLSGQCLEGDCVNGKGTFINADNNLYIGTFKNGKLNGKGVCHFSWGTKYVGGWIDGNFNGKGVYYYPEGKIEQGIWENGILTLASETTQNSKFHAIVIGINEYDGNNNLKYAASDARSIYEFLTMSQFSTYASGDIRLLLNQGATIEKLKSSLTTIKDQAGEDDIFMFFFFGNGQNKSLELVDGTLQFSALTDMFSTVKVSETMSFFDLSELNENELFTMKEATKSQPLSVKNNIIYLEKIKENTIEYDGLRFGVMKHYLYQSLRGAGDTNLDGKTSIEEIHKYLSRKIISYSDGYLVPNLSTTSTSFLDD